GKHYAGGRCRDKPKRYGQGVCNRSNMQAEEWPSRQTGEILKSANQTPTRAGTASPAPPLKCYHAKRAICLRLAFYDRYSFAFIMTRLLIIFTSTALASLAVAQNDSGGNDTGPDHALLKPVAQWSFDGSDSLGTWLGKAAPDQAGPRAPVYPSFAKDNKAALFSGNGTKLALEVKDATDLRFGLNDTITLEAWVKIKSLKDGETPYLIGKGRNGTKEFGATNQNYALRLKGEKGGALIGFLFASAEVTGKKSDWHRWWSKEGFDPGTGWHHVAVTYTYGKPKSIKGFIDGKAMDGVWDMGGATDRAPVVDGDTVVIGTGSTRAPTHSFNGWLDDLAVYRGKPEDENLKSFAFVPPPPPVKRSQLTKGRVLVQICEDDVPAANAWPPEPPRVAESYDEDVFGLFEVPEKYVDTGVRGDRPNPSLVRAAALVTLPKGKHRLLLRGRGAAHLYVDGKTVINNAFPNVDGSGHGLVAKQEKYLNLGPDFRFAPPGNEENWVEYQSDGREHLVVLETMLGGMAGKAKRRPELGETVVAWSREGSESWSLLSPGTRQVAYTDAGWAAYEAERRLRLNDLNTKARAKVREQNAPYWNKRREAVNAWLAKVPAIDAPAAGAIDFFIEKKIAAVSEQNSAAKKGSVDFFKDVQPLFETRCVECHRGTKAKGGLHLESLADAMKGGKSDGAAITPGKPEKSSILARVASTDADEVMPPKGEHLSAKEVVMLTTWIREGASWPEFKGDHLALLPATDDLSFLRRVTLDTVGVVPSLEEIAAFQKNPARAATIDHLLEDPRWADHWMGYWQDVLAENPNILNPTLNNTGPFRWWIYESLLDNKPMDLFVTELIRMKGSERFGGPAGFAVASQNDVPMAAKGTIVSAAFLGVEMKCARCHDSPANKSTQEQLFQLAALLNTEEVAVPVTSSVNLDRFKSSGRKPLIQVTLAPGIKVQPKWPFGEFCDEKSASLAQDEKDPRDTLAALITAPQNERFAQVMANRVWSRFMGRGIVEPVSDWEKGRPTHPELLHWLGREFVRGGYDVKHLARLILNSKAYQRATDQGLKETSPLYTSPAPRRLNAEQIVDSLFAATGKPFKTEEVSLDIDGQRDEKNSLTLGQPRRSWMLTSTSNERDRPSLALPRIQAVGDVLSAFGWRGSRQDPISTRESAPNVLQPAILSNGTVGIWLTRLSDDHGNTSLVLQDQPLDKLIDTLFLKL
ncbi:MAG: Protein of unknown function (DUF1553)/Protein of unknown function (DUF1549)/Planctomycete, partial [Verrucomicrobiaceae bacterium]|nr:Protein of unknown function (DUF1553)/Protein of unknown function (DUF1549)/Planctomycete [Verrucomicrobiaceae bacterium]